MIARHGTTVSTLLMLDAAFATCCRVDADFNSRLMSCRLPPDLLLPPMFHFAAACYRATIADYRHFADFFHVYIRLRFSI